MSLFIIFSRHDYHLLLSNGLELLCNVCYQKFLLIVFVVRLHHRASLSCSAKCYLSKLGYRLFLYSALKKNKNHKFSIFFSLLVPKVSHFFRNGCKPSYYAPCTLQSNRTAQRTLISQKDFIVDNKARLNVFGRF